MKLHVKHLKSNKKVNFLSFNYFAYSIFEEEKKKVGEEKKKRKKWRKVSWFWRHLFFPSAPNAFTISLHGPAIMGQGWGSWEDGSADNWGALAALKHL